MKFDHLLEIAGEEPVFEAGLLLAGDVAPADVRRQFSLCQIRAWALALLALPYQRIQSHPFPVANRLAWATLS